MNALLARSTFILSTLCLLFIVPAFAQTITLPVAIDFSYAGYGGGGVQPPKVPAVILVHSTGGDDTRLLQAAVDHAAKLPVQANGFRGAVQLAAEKFILSGRLRVQVNGIVIRGSRAGEKVTTLIAGGKDRRTLLEIGKSDTLRQLDPVAITDEKVPAGSKTLTLQSIRDLRVGDRIIVTRPTTREWISALGMDTIKGVFTDRRLHWTPGSRNLVWDRTITAIEPAQKQITLDAPVTTALEQRYGAGIVAKAAPGQPSRNTGIENLVIESSFDPFNPKDEEHSWIAIAMDNTEDVFIRNVTARHFVHAAFRVGSRARRVTLERCRAEKPVAEIGGYRRQNFLVEGQQVLAYQCFSEEGMNDFAVGFCAGGPNTYLECTASRSYGPSGSFESWASGTLYEQVNVDKAGIKLAFDLERAQAGGWTAANSVVWNCPAKEVTVNGPPGAPNIVHTSGEPLYRVQLTKRLGQKGAGAFFASAYTPPAVPATLRVFKVKNSLSVPTKKSSPVPPLQIINGRFVINGQVVWGGAVNDAWWLGQTAPVSARNTGVSITRYVPGKTGVGLTEDLSGLAAGMVKRGMYFYQSGPCLWYDRRRDEHSVVERTDGNVWAPFYEMPWQRSGKGKAWDGLSRFDLTRYNTWFYDRTREFAALCDRNGIVLYHNLYNTHNILEIGAHWADYPWRPANNINETGLPEPPPMEPNNRLHMANQFYNVDATERKKLHHDFIIHVLDKLGSFQNIIFCVGFQFAGPLDFQEFFNNTVAEWERTNNRTLRLMLSTSKDITDSILANPAWEKQVAVIDMRYWQYRSDGKLWAPRGGQNLAFREMIGKEFGRGTDAPPPTTPQMVYKQVREYRDKYPDKALIAWHHGTGPIPILMGGGSQALMQNPTAGHDQGQVADTTLLDSFVKRYLSSNLMNMKPRDGMLAVAENNWLLADDAGHNLLVYSLSGPAVVFTQKLKGKGYKGVWFNPRTGTTKEEALTGLTKENASIQKPTAESWMLLLRDGGE